MFCDDREDTYTIKMLDKIASEARDFDFFQAVRLIKRIVNEDRTLYFETHVSLAHTVSDIEAIQFDKSNITLWVTFIGLIGQLGIMPAHYTGLLLERLNKKDETLQAFFSIFQHRIITLLYKAWEQSQIYLSLDQGNYNNEMISLLKALTGQFGGNTPRWEENINLYYSNFYNNQRRSVMGLLKIIEDHFALPVTITEHVGEWITIEKEQLTYLKRGYNNQLNHNMIVGRRAWHLQDKFTLTVGNISYQKFLDLLPNKPMMKKIQKIIASYCGYHLQYNIVVKIIKSSIPLKPLGKKHVMQLGWNTWLNKTGNINTKDLILIHK